MPRAASTRRRPAQDRSAEATAPELSGVAEDLAAKLEKLGIRCWFDLVLHLPLRYEDETRVMALRDAPSGRLSPISRVRSRTDISITVRMPMAPSIRAMADTTGTS